MRQHLKFPFLNKGIEKAFNELFVLFGQGVDLRELIKQRSIPNRADSSGFGFSKKIIETDIKCIGKLDEDSRCWDKNPSFISGDSLAIRPR